MIVPLIVDEAIEDYIEAVEVLENSVEKFQTTFKEVGTFGTDEWSISKSHKAFTDD